MKTESATVIPVAGPPRSVTQSLLFTLPMAAATFLMLSQGHLPAQPARIFALAATMLFLNITFFLMLRSGKTDRYRALIFVTYAVAFVVSFSANLVETRGSTTLNEADMLAGNTPFCHIVIPMTLIPAALTKTIIFPGSIIGRHASIAGMFILWIGASLAIGRGFCSWACFFGGLEDGLSRILRTPLIRRISPAWKYLPFGILLAVVLSSAATLSPTYCTWLCPFKTTTEHVQITSLKTLVQTVIFVSLFIGLVVVLPILMKRRTQCGLFCPFGAFQSFTNRLNPFDIRIDREKCVNCGRCEQVCPTFSLSRESIAAGQSGITCSKCGKCVDDCPRNAISFHIKGTSIGGMGNGTARLLFLYPAFLFLAIMGGGMIRDAIVRVVTLVSTGSMI